MSQGLARYVSENPILQQISARKVIPPNIGVVKAGWSGRELSAPLRELMSAYLLLETHQLPNQHTFLQYSPQR